jgi:hypothetical protein
VSLRQLAQLLEIPRPETSIQTAKAEAHSSIAATSKSFEQARRYVQLTQFEFEESPDHERISLGNLETALSRAEDIFAVATSLARDQAWDEWQQLPPAAKIAESELRNVAARQVERAANSDIAKDAGTDLSAAFARWNEAVQPLQVKNSRVALVSQIVTEGQQL